MLRMICRVMLRDKMESTVIALKVGVDNLEDHLKQKKIMVVQTYCKKR